MFNSDQYKDAMEMNPVQRIVGIIFSPSAVFNAIKVSPEWLLPMVIVLASAFFTSYITLHYIDWEEETMKSLQPYIDDGQIQQDEVDKILESQRKTEPYIKIFTPIFSVIAGAVILLAIAFVLHLASNLLAGMATFAQMFALTCYSSIIGVLHSIVYVIGVITSGSTNIKTSLAIILPAEASRSLTYLILDRLDIFSIWSVFIFALGFSIVPGIKRGKAFPCVIGLWLIVQILAVLYNLFIMRSFPS